MIFTGLLLEPKQMSVLQQFVIFSFWSRYETLGIHRYGNVSVLNVLIIYKHKSFMDKKTIIFLKFG